MQHLANGFVVFVRSFQEFEKLPRSLHLELTFQLMLQNQPTQEVIWLETCYHHLPLSLKTICYFDNQRRQAKRKNPVFDVFL